MLYAIGWIFIAVSGQKMWKMIHLVSSIGIRTNDRLIVSLLI